MALWQRQQDDAQAVFTRVFEEYRYTMLHVAMGVLRDRHLAEDALQNAFMKILEHWERFRDFPTPQTKNLALIIVKNKSIDLLRRERGQLLPLEELEAESPDPTPEEAFLQQQDYEALLGAIGQLSESYRTALQLKCIHGCTDAEMAALLDITPKNANVRVFRAKRALRQALEEKNREKEEIL